MVIPRGARISDRPSFVRFVRLISFRFGILTRPLRRVLVLKADEAMAIAHLAVDNNEGSIIHLNDDDALRFV